MRYVVVDRPKNLPSYIIFSEQIYARARFPQKVNLENSWSPSRVIFDNLFTVLLISSVPIGLPAVQTVGMGVVSGISCSLINISELLV